MERFAGRFALLRPLGKGGMGQVWLALDVSSRTECALKRLEMRLPHSQRDSLRKEFELLTRVRHPAVVSVYELGFANDGTPFFTMELAPGRAADLALSPGDWTGFYSVASRLTAGLEALHAAGIVHGDVKPSNLLVSAARDPREGPASVRLVDFGLAALIERDRAGHRGTPGFAAPEVIRGAPLSIASDLYSLGATLFVLAVGAARGAGRQDGQPVRPPKDSQAAALALAEAPVPGPLTQLVLRLLSATPESRPRSAREVRGELARLHPAARQSLADGLRSEVLIGRSAELARIERWLALGTPGRAGSQSAAGQQGGGGPSGKARRASEPGYTGAPLMLLSGELGVGKTTLLRELAVRAALAGRTVVSCSCAAGARAGETARTILLRLAAAAPEIGRAPGSAEPGEIRRRLEAAEAIQPADLPALVESAIEWGREIRRGRGPALLLLDDVENLDALSLAFVRRLVSHADAGVFRWLWASAPETARRDEGDGVLREAGIAEALELRRLSRADSDRLLSARLRSETPAELADAIWQRCGGHPGWMVEALRIVIEAGALRETEDGITLDRDALDGVTWPDDLEAALRRRLARLGPAPIAAAAALAAWSAPATPEDLAAIEPAATREAVEALRESGLAVVGADGRLALSPPVLARGLLASMPEDERGRLYRAALARPDLPHAQRFALHRGAGEVDRALDEARRALEASTDWPLALEAAALAASRAPEVAAEWEERAGKLMLERGRYREALPHLERAVSLTPAGGPRGPRQHLLSGAYQRTGATHKLEALLEDALAGDLRPRDRALLLVNRAAARTRAGDWAAARDLGEEAFRLAEASVDGEAEGLALLNLGSITLREPDGAKRTQDFARRAAAAFARAGHELGRLRSAVLLSHGLWAEQRHEEAERVCREALGGARRHDLRLAMHELVRALSLILVERGRWSEAKHFEEEGLRIAIEEDWPGMVGEGLTTLMILDALTGNAARALRRAPAASRLVRRHQRYMLSLTMRAAALAYRTAGRLRPAARALRAAIDAIPAGGFLPEIQWTGIEHGNLLSRGGRWPQAGLAWRRAFEERPAVDSVSSAILAIQLARAEVRSGDPEAAERLGREAETWLDGHAVAYAEAHARQLAAELALTRGEVEAGARAVDVALAAFGALPAPADAAGAALEFARLAMRGGLAARVPVGEWLEKAAAGFDLVGDRSSREKALALAVDWYRRYAAAAPAVARDRDLLTAVARLLDSLTDLDQLLREAMRMAVEQLDAERGVLLLADEDGVGLRPMVEHGAVDAATRDQALSFSRAVVDRVAKSGGSVMIEDASSDLELRSKSMVELGLRSVLCVPLFVKEKVVGAVYLDDSRRPETFGVPERGLLEGFAHLLAMAIENSRGQEQVRRTNEQLVGENLSLRREASVRYRPENFIGGSLAMRRVLAVVERAAATSSTVLITGENGTGKELIARMLHHAGPRAMKPFVAVNCGAIPEPLLESELFGHERGAFTDARRAREGKFELAHEGTLFLDEIGEMPISHQVRLLRVLAERSVTRVGGDRPIPVDVRVIAASNQDLVRRMAEGAFRQDLWYRLNVIPIEVPPLRERKADIPALAQHFVRTFASQMGRELPTLTPALIAVLMQSDWPGNVRELQNYIERLMAMSPGKVLEPSPLPHDLHKRAEANARGERVGSLEDMVAELEREQLLGALDRHQGNQSRAARELGLTEQSLRYRLRKYQMPSSRRFRRVR